jgi:alkaline phosphatase D
MKKYINLITLFLLSHSLIAQIQKKVVAGPMIGYTEHREICIWLQTTCAQKVTIQYKRKDSKEKPIEIMQQLNAASNCNPVNLKFYPSLLEPGVTYNYEILLDNKSVSLPYPLSFTTKPLWEWRTDAPEFSFLAGSCLYLNDSAYDRPGQPYGQGTQIIETMSNTPAQMVLWLGDNTYTREVDYSSASGLRYRYQHMRVLPELQKLLATKINYAIWDDHDFGYNDGNKTYPLKDISREIFQEYWANQTYGENNEGIYTTFSQSDAQFFMLDNRFFRDENFLDEKSYPNKSQLGEKQLDWYLQSLLKSRATFKFVCMGGQFLNEYTDKESYQFFKNERKKIINFIVDNKISGVIFLSGDRHHTELLNNTSVKDSLGYTLYELTSSAISSGPNTKAEKDNPMRVDGTLVVENNFCKLTLSGKRKERKVVIECINKTGSILWTQTISENQLKARRD